MEQFKKNNGFTGIDIALAVLIITIFMSVITSLYVNLYTSNIDILRREQAVGYATSILEKIDELYYNEVNNENFEVNEESNGKKMIAGIEIDKGYNVDINIQTYNPENLDVDFVKTINLTINYEVGNKQKNVNFTKIKEKEEIVVPNIPDLENNEMIPVKYNSNNKLIKTNSNDKLYLNKKWAIAVKKSDITNNGNVIEPATVYIWIPKFAYNGKNVEFIYGYGNKTVDKNGNLINISSEYEIPSEFSDGISGIWISLSEINSNNASKILNESIYGPIEI